MDREFETIDLTHKILDFPTGVKLEDCVIKEIGSNTLLTTQTVDNDGDGTMDVLLFQPKIKASSHKDFEILISENPSKEATVSCYSRFVQIGRAHV